MVPKIRPRARHINIKCHYFSAVVRTSRITLCPVDTKEQIADIFIKPLNKNQFLYPTIVICLHIDFISITRNVDFANSLHLEGGVMQNDLKKYFG